MFKQVLTGIALVLVLGAAPTLAQNEGGGKRPVPPEVKWHRFDEAIVAARSAGKHIMVDVYTDWCGWCKKLDKETYADFAVREVLAESYVSVKVKGDSGKRLKVQGHAVSDGGQTRLQFVRTDEPVTTEKQLTKSIWQATGSRGGFPTIAFLTPEGQLLTGFGGFVDAARFHDMINFIKDDLYEVMSYQDYLESLKKADEAAQEKS
jgi:thioredoxin-related protein